MAHQVAVIGGDGIGPEVVAEALKVVAAAGVDLATTDFDLGGARYLRDGTVLPDEVLDELRGFDAILLGAVGTPEVPPGVIERGLLLKMRFALDQYINQRPFTEPTNGHRHGRHPGEHRGHLRRRGRLPPPRHPARGRHPGLGQHPHGRRALRPLRLRPGPAAAQPPHPGPQDQRPDLLRRPVAAHLRRGRRRVPRRGDGLQPRRRRLHLLRAGPGSLRRRSSPTTSSATSSPTSAVPCPAASAWPRRATSTPTAPARRCSSRCTARRPTSPARRRPTPWPPSCPQPSCSTSSTRPPPPTASAPPAPRSRPTSTPPDEASGPRPTTTPEIGDAVAERL